MTILEMRENNLIGKSALVEGIPHNCAMGRPKRSGKGMDLKGKNVLVVGLARSGISAARLLIQKGANVTVTDIKSSQELAENLKKLPEPIKVKLGDHSDTDFQSADLVVVSPGVPFDLEVLERSRECGIEVIGEVELAYRFLEGEIIGVTGSNGKTTTTSLIGAILDGASLSHSVSGNIGLPLSEIAAENFQSPLHVVELSSFQLEMIAEFRCHIALLLNITPDHLDRHSSLDSYRSAKLRILENQTSDDFAVINYDDSWLRDSIQVVSGRTFPFSLSVELEEGVFVKDGKILSRLNNREERIMETRAIRLRGSHNLENALAAIAACLLAGAEPHSIADSVSTFAGVEHRLEQVRLLNGIHFFNDSKATNVDAARRAIESFEEPLVLIMGGLDKGADFSDLRDSVRQGVRGIVLIGKASKAIDSSLGDLVPTFSAVTMEDAVNTAYELARKGDVVLLSPGCASFDMFLNYEERGSEFKRQVMKLKTRLEAEGRTE